MARIDKYQPETGGFRARLAADWLEADIGAIIAVSLDTNGRVVKGAGTQGIVGICVLQNFSRTKAGDQVDVMTSGELVEVTGLTGQAAGKKMYMAANGTISATVPGAGVNGYKLGQIVEADRLVVRFQEMQGA